MRTPYGTTLQVLRAARRLPQPVRVAVYVYAACYLGAVVVSIFTGRGQAVTYAASGVSARPCSSAWQCFSTCVAPPRAWSL